jgi:pimeloyl-ACP methyl ester carboxylesterase
MAETPLTAVGTDGVELAMRVFDPPSDDAPGLLLHHGLASSSHIWDLMLPSLTRRFAVVAFDARGHGRSSKPTSGYGFDRVVADAIAVADSVGLHRPILMGHSWGAMVALEAVAAHPRRFAGAILVDGGVVPIGRLMDWPTTKERLAPPRLAGMPAADFRAMIRTFFAGTIEVTPDVEEIVMAVMRIRSDGTIAPRLSRANHFRILHAIWRQDPLSLYPRTQIPTLAIMARSSETGDPFAEVKRAAVSDARRASKGRPVRFSWMDGIHDLPLQHPQALAGRVRRFAASGVR